MKNENNIPLNDDIENNPDRNYIHGPYSTFDPELSHQAKQLAQKYNELQKLKNYPELSQFVESKKLSFKRAAQLLASKKITDNGNTVVKYLQSFRKNIMSAILNNEILLNYALQFDKIPQYKQEEFLRILDRVLSNKYNVEYSNVLYNPNKQNGAVFTKEENTTNLVFNEKLNNLDECIKFFTHEFSHKLVSEQPNLTPFGAQTANIAHKFYISSKQDKHEYLFNADELLSYTVEKSVSNNFEQDLRAVFNQIQKNNQINI